MYHVSAQGVDERMINVYYYYYYYHRGFYSRTFLWIIYLNTSSIFLEDYRFVTKHFGSVFVLHPFSSLLF